MNKKLGYILIAISLFFPTYVFAETGDTSDMMMTVEFLDSVNSQNASKTLSYFLDSGNETPEIRKSLFNLLTSAFGKIEIIDFSDPQKIKEACGTDRCSTLALGTKYYENESNPVVYSLYKVKYEKGGQGFLQISYPGDEKTGAATQPKFAQCVFIFLKDGNFMQFTKMMSEGQKLSENKNDVSNP